MRRLALTFLSQVAEIAQNQHALVDKYACGCSMCGARCVGLDCGQRTW